MTNRAIRVGNWKLVAKGKDGPWELYDLGTDRCESKNLAGTHPDKVAQMSKLWQRCEDKFRAQADLPAGQTSGRKPTSPPARPGQPNAADEAENVTFTGTKSSGRRQRSP